MKKRILFITQNLDRTGSEMVLWYLLNNLDRERYAVCVFCLRKGELVDRLPAHIERHVQFKSSKRWSERTTRRIVRFLGYDPLIYQLKAIHQKFKADIWFLNTIAVADAIKAAEGLDVKVVTYIHEMLNAFALIKSEAMHRLISRSDVLVGCSRLVCDQLKVLGHRDVRIQESFIDVSTLAPDLNGRDLLRAKLGILPSDFVWTVSGGASYMKGLDFVLPILEAFKDEAVKVLWIGAVPGNGLDYYVARTAEVNYPGKLIFTGVLSEGYHDHLAAANGTLLLSREESFSLVLIESALLGIPVVAFDVGIARDFIEEGMGKVIEGRDERELIAAMRWLHQHPDQDKEKLKKAAMRYSLEVQLPHFEQLISEIVN